jgi:hypothetical protein
MDPDPGGPKTYGSDGSGSATLIIININVSTESLHGSTVGLHPQLQGKPQRQCYQFRLFPLLWIRMRIRIRNQIRLFTLMRIRIQYSKLRRFQADPDPQQCTEHNKGRVPTVSSRSRIAEFCVGGTGICPNTYGSY